MPPHPSDPGPDDRDSLSDWEREALAGIEHDLATSDPRLAEAMASVASAGWRPPLPWLWILALVAGLLVLVIGWVLVLGPSWAPFGLFIAMVVATWVLTCSTEKLWPG
jgi:Flp pilus assembly protein TadB